MRIIINVKQIGTKMSVVPKLDQGSRDNINEINAGQALYEHISQAFSTMEAEQNRPLPLKWRIWGAIRSLCRGRKGK